MATLESVYRDVVSRVNELNLENDIYFSDYMKAINDAIVLQRSELVKKGLGHYLATREMLFFTKPDFEYPFLNSALLSRPILKDVPVPRAIVATNVWSSSTDISKAAKEYLDGNRKNRLGENYIAISDIPGTIASFGRIFDSSAIRNYKRANGLTYKTGDVVKDVNTQKVFRLRSDFTAILDRDLQQIPVSSPPLLGPNDLPITDGNGQPITASDQNPIIPQREEEQLFEELFWKRTGENYLTAVYREFTDLRELKLFGDIPNQVAMTVKNQTLYISSKATRMVIEYIPEWTYIEDLETELDIPESVVATVKIQAVQIVTSHKLGKDSVDDRIKRTAGAT